MDELLSKCWLIKNAFKINVELVDHQLQTILHISDDSEPFLFIESRKRMYVDVQKALEEANKDSFCFHTDSFQLSYLAVGLHEDGQFQGMFLAGPFLNERVTDQLIWNVMKENHLENNWVKPFEKFYKSLPYLGQSYLAIGDMIVNLLVNPRVASQFITPKKINKPYQPDVQPQDYDMDGLEVKLRYEAEKKFLHFIELGDKENAIKTLIEYTGDFSYRVPGNPLRAKKNLSFSSNTLTRLAAAKGGVEPQYLHAISEKFALRIEAAVTMAELDTLNFNMIEEYVTQLGFSPLGRER